MINSHLKSVYSIGLATSLCVGLLACSGNEPANDQNSQQVKNLTQNKATQIWPKLNIAVKKDPEMESKIAALINKMTLEQKVAQMIQPEIRDITVEDMRQYGFGSYLNGGGAFPNNNKYATPADWVKLAEDMYQASLDDTLDGINIPTMWGTDAVHGHNNVIGATLFPHNIGLGAANNPELIEKIAAITATEVMVTGIDWVFAPTVAVVRDDRWGRTYEGYSEDPAIVKSYASSIVKGLQGSVDQDFLAENRVIGTVKHFLGDGGTQDGDDQGNNLDKEQALFDIHGQGYVGGLTAGAQTVMASFNSWNGEKNHGNKYLLTDVLKTQMGFDGLVVGDWNGHGQIPGCTNESCSQTVNAGLDIFMVPTDAWKPLYNNTIAQVKSGEIKVSRIDDAVTRILRVKMRAGLFSKPSPAKRLLSGKTSLVGAKAHREIARQAVSESLVLLKNKNNILPLTRNQKILVTGNGAHNIGKQSGGWSITWQGIGNTNEDFPGGTSIYQGFESVMQDSSGTIELSLDGKYTQKPDVAIVVFGEEPYAEGNGDIDNLDYQRGNKTDLALLKKLKSQGIKVVSVFISGRPLWVNAELNASDAFVAAWLPGSEGEGVADVLFSKADGEINKDFKGKLSYSWPKDLDQTSLNKNDTHYDPLFPYGYGLTYGDTDILANNLNESINYSTQDLQSLAVFERAVKAPWKLLIADQSSLVPVTSSVQNNQVVTIKTQDRFVQEDTRTVTFNGKGLGRVIFKSDFPKDLRAYSQTNGTLSVDFMREDKITADIKLGMSCFEDCNSDFDITEKLNQFAVNEWHKLSIDLKCFENKNLNLGNIYSPFLLSSQGKAKLSFSQIELRPQGAEKASISCQ